MTHGIGVRPLAAATLRTDRCSDILNSEAKRPMSGYVGTRSFDKGYTSTDLTAMRHQARHDGDKHRRQQIMNGVSQRRCSSQILSLSSFSS